MSGRLLWLWCCLLPLLALVGCHRNNDELAKLENKQGAVERDFAAELKKWSAAPVAATFKVGDGVRTSGGAKATLRLSDASQLVLQEKTLLRFLATRPGEKAHGLDVQAGEVELTAGREGLNIETESGPARLEPGSRVKLSKTERGTRFAVEIGAAHLTEAKLDLKAGESIEIGIGRAIIERSSPESVPAVSSAAASQSPVAPPVPDAAADTDTRPRGPETVDLLAGAGDSLIVHDPHPPTVVGFAAPQCVGTTVLELGTKKRTTIGTGRVTAAFPAGVQRYRLYCDPEKSSFANGTISVIRDSGSRRLASAAPANRIDADGRRYTILYQSLLPKVSVRWPNPPSTGPFSLTVRSKGRSQKQFSAQQASYSLPAGSLGEGSHELWFEGGGQRSRTTTVVVQFDNAAPTASISAPSDRAFAPGATVPVAGMALPGWAVSVAGRELSQDSQLRFAGEAQAPGDTRALVIRFSHPQRGVHYYLRRSSR